MKVVIFGGTGFVGRNLTKELQQNGHEVWLVTRDIRNSSHSLSNVKMIEWCNTEPLEDIDALKSVDVIINLAGQSIGNARWTSSVKQEILESRVRTTQAIVSAINAASIHPKILVNASAVGYYGFRKDEEITEVEQAGDDFLAQVCKAWESEAYKVHINNVRVVTVRIGVVLGSEGALKKMMLPFKFFLGGPLGTGRQYLSWIHIHDLTRLISFVAENQEVSGPVNATAPDAVKMADFCKVLGEVLSRPSWLPVPEFVLRGVLGQMAEMLVYGQRVIPKKIINAGFEFKFTTLRPALKDILGQR